MVDTHGDNPYMMGIATLASGRTAEALGFFRMAVEETGSPVASSYLAYCQARQDGTIRESISRCTDAIKLEPRAPEIYLNLGRIYLLSGHKRAAIRSFQLGLRYGRNTEISIELKRLGHRKNPPLSFLPRSHPLNKYVGKFLSRISLR